MQISDSHEKYDESSDRKGFIRKVYSILSVQLLVTAGFITYVKVNPEVNA